jgi:diguanylate cyclase (GGDEF)-like protein
MGIKTRNKIYYPLIVFAVLSLTGLAGAVFVIYQQKDIAVIDYRLAIFIQVSAIITGAALAYILKQTMFQTAHLRKEIFQRVTEMKEYLQIRQESEANNRLLNVVMDTLTIGICAFSPDMTMLKWNNNLEAILDLPEGTVKEGILYKVLTKHLDQISCQASEDINSTSTRLHVIEDSFLKQDISYFERNLQDGRTLEISMAPMPDGGFVVVYSDITQRKKAERVIRHMAHFDSLTGLANRANFTEKLEGLLNQKRQGDDTVTLALIDLDKFKDVNDTYGHPMGDALLQRVSEILNSKIRDNDFVARIGGDEFAILFPNTSNIKEVTVPLNRMLKALMKPIIIRGTKLNIGASIGVSLFPQHATSTESLIKAADDALYRVKENGRGNIEIASMPDNKVKIPAM